MRGAFHEREVDWIRTDTLSALHKHFVCAVRHALELTLEILDYDHEPPIVHP